MPNRSQQRSTQRRQNRPAQAKKTTKRGRQQVRRVSNAPRVQRMQSVVPRSVRPPKQKGRTSRPSLVNLTKQLGPPSMMSGKTFLTAVASGGTQTYASAEALQRIIILPLNPMKLSDPILAQRAGTYERYVWTKLHFTYVPSIPSTTSGSICLAIASYPVMDSKLASQSKLTKPLISHVSSELSYDVDIRTDDASYLRETTSDTRHVVDSYLHVSWTCNASGVDIDNVGSLFCEYELALFGSNPEPVVALPTNLEARWVTGAYAAGGGFLESTYTYPDAESSILCSSVEVADTAETRSLCVDSVFGINDTLRGYGLLSGSQMKVYDIATGVELDPSMYTAHKLTFSAGSPTEFIAPGTIIAVFKIAKIVAMAGKLILSVFGYSSFQDFIRGNKIVPTYSQHAALTADAAYAVLDHPVSITVLQRTGTSVAQEGTFNLVPVTLD